jgi:hypothetical protein
MNDAEKLIRESLADGPTPGPWHHDSDPIKNDPLHRVRFRVTAKGRTITETYYSSAQPGAPFTSGEADNRFIAACSPENIASLLADRDEREAKMLAEIDRLRAAVQHEADCVEAAKAEIERLTRERDEARAERDALAKQGEAFRHLVDACKLLASEAEEYEFDDGMGRGAMLDYWHEFDRKLDAAINAQLETERPE